MADIDNDAPTSPSYLEMTDAEMMASAPPVETAAVVAAEEPEVVVPAVDPADPVDSPALVVSDADIDKETLPADLVDKVPTDKTTDPVDPADQPKQELAVIDFEAEYKRLLTPFKANGHDIAIDSVDDAIQLMQMGANYNKKMAALKPNLKLMKLLENNGLLSEEKISYLIDLEKKNPDAINRLVKESGINPMDLDAEKAGDYKPKIHSVDDREMELDTVLEDISFSPAYTRTLDIVSTKWDGASKQVLAETPELLRVINDHVDRGIYDLISKEVERERMFDRLNGLSDIQAYRKVGDAIQARGGFNHLSDPQKKTPTLPVVVPPKPKADDDALKDKRRAASSTKLSAPTSQAKDFNPLGLSDAEFGKLVNPKYV